MRGAPARQIAVFTASRSARVERLREILLQILDVFQSHIDSHEIVRDAGIRLFLLARVEEDRRSRMDHERARVADVRDIERVVQRIDETERALPCAEAQREHRAVAPAA